MTSESGCTSDANSASIVPAHDPATELLFSNLKGQESTSPSRLFDENVGVCSGGLAGQVIKLALIWSFHGLHLREPTVEHACREPLCLPCAIWPQWSRSASQLLGISCSSTPASFSSLVASPKCRTSSTRLTLHKSCSRALRTPTSLTNPSLVRSKTHLLLPTLVIYLGAVRRVVVA